MRFNNAFVVSMLSLMLVSGVHGVDLAKYFIGTDVNKAWRLCRL